MDRLQTLLALTQQLEKLMNEHIDTQNRDDIMKRVEELLEKRGKFLSQIIPPFSDEELRIGRQVVRLNERVEQKMNEQFEALKWDMKQAKKQKKSNRSYLNPYESIKTADGMYMDKRN